MKRIFLQNAKKIYLTRPQFALQAEAWIRKAVEADERNRMPWDLATDYALYAEFFKKQGDPAQAKENLHKAIDLMRGCGAVGWVKKYGEELAGL